MLENIVELLFWQKLCFALVLPEVKTLSSFVWGVAHFIWTGQGLSALPAPASQML